MLGMGRWCRRYARIFAESPEDYCGSPCASGGWERQSEPAKDGRIVGEVNWALRTEAALRGDDLLGEQMRGDFAEVPHDPEPGHNLQSVVGDVDLPPEEALARRSHKVMMVVVPAFAEGEQGEEPVIAAGVRGLGAAGGRCGGEESEREKGRRYRHRAA